MVHETPLLDIHRRAGGKLVDFNGWHLPLHYGSQIAEHHAVRQAAGMFDVSHMTAIDIHGERAEAFLRYLLANDVAKLSTGQVLYTAMLNERGGVIDDLTVYRLSAGFRLVVNCATRDKVLRWMAQQSQPFGCPIAERADLAMLAVQGPEALDKVTAVLQEQGLTLERLARFTAKGVTVNGREWFVAATGYTGEAGYEILLPGEQAPALWQALHKAGVQPCGLGARDTLRLEAGMNLYGNEMDEQVSPLAANMGWTVAWQPEERDFIGRQALQQEKQRGPSHVLKGLVYTGKGVLRAGQKLVCDAGDGHITSGSFSPTLACSIALARVPVGSVEARVELRKKHETLALVKPAFVRNGKKLI